MAFGKHQKAEEEPEEQPQKHRRFHHAKRDEQNTDRQDQPAQPQTPMNFQPLNVSQADAASGDNADSDFNDSSDFSDEYVQPTFSDAAAGGQTGQGSASNTGTSAPSSTGSFVPASSSDSVASAVDSSVGLADGAAKKGSGKYSRGASALRYQDQKHTKHKHRKRIIAIIVIVALLVVAAGAAFAYSYFHGKINTINNNFQQGLDSDLNDALVSTASDEDPFYVLLMGTDESIQRNEDHSTGDTYRTDSIILARIDPKDKKVTLISFPRDTKVQLQGHGTQKLNAAYAFGGASLAVSTVSQLAGVDISHFMLIDMDGLSKAVDDLGGIDVNVPVEIDDDDYTGHLDAGEQTLNGEQALIFARSRHAYDDYGDGDLYRAANQRTVITAIANKLLSSDMVTLTNTVTDLSSYIQTDLSVDDLLGYGNALRGIDTENDVYSASVPSEAELENGVWYNETDQKAWQAMMDRVKQGLPPTDSTEIDPATGITLSSSGDGSSGAADADASSSASSGTNDSSGSSSTDSSSASSTATKAGKVVVKNGSGVSGAARTVAQKLTSSGYTVVKTGDASSDDYTRTYVIYSSAAYADEAQAIADQIGGSCHVALNDGKYKLTSDILVIVGSSDAGVSG